MTLNGRYALSCRKDAYFGANHKNLNEDRPILPAEKCRPITLLSDDVGLCGYSQWFPGEGASNDSGVVDNGNFQRFRWLFFVNFRDEASVII